MVLNVRITEAFISRVITIIGSPSKTVLFLKSAVTERADRCNITLLMNAYSHAACPTLLQGISLCIGQKIRICIARALYSKADLVILVMTTYFLFFPGRHLSSLYCLQTLYAKKFLRQLLIQWMCINLMIIILLQLHFDKISNFTYVGRKTWN